MDRFKRVLRGIFCVPRTVRNLLLPLSGVAQLIAAFRLGAGHPFSFFCYALTAYTVAVWCARIPVLFQKIRHIKNTSEYAVRLTEDFHFQVKISLYIALFTNIGYALFLLGLGLFHASDWYYSLAIYYILLVLVRIFLLRDVWQPSEEVNVWKELRRYRFCGVVLFFMGVVWSGIVTYIVLYQYGFSHSYVTTVILGACTGISLTIAIFNLIKYRKLRRPVFLASKIISLVVASTSVLTTQTAILAIFGNEDSNLRYWMTAITGTCTCLLLFGISIFMMIRSSVALRRQRIDELK